MGWEGSLLHMIRDPAYQSSCYLECYYLPYQQEEKDPRECHMTSRYSGAEGTCVILLRTHWPELVTGLHTQEAQKCDPIRWPACRKNEISDEQH